VTREKKKIEVLGKCPACGSGVIEGQKGFGCNIGKMYVSLLFERMINF